MDVSKINLQKILAMLSQPKTEFEPIKGIVEKRIDVKYLGRDGKPDIRPIRLTLPPNVEGPVPLVYVAHYEMPVDSIEARDYLASGFAVASCADFKNEYNSTLTSDDLIFNNAALYTLRGMPEIDGARIAVVGGSAGGYMSLMLNAMQLGICCSVANGPICNAYFNFYRYFDEAVKYNSEAYIQAASEGIKDPVGLLGRLPIPFLGMICAGGGFQSGVAYIEDKNDMRVWEAISPTALAECFCNPLYINQATSDILVPIDQLTKKYTYQKCGETLPEDFDCRMPTDIAGKLGYSLCDRLDGDQLNLFKVEPITDGSEKPYEFDPSKRFNVCITDEGAPESYSSHNLGIANGRTTDIEYIRRNFALTAAKTNVLTVEKLLLFAERYDGKALQLTAHVDTDDTAYGSLAVYRKEIVDELAYWVKNNGFEALSAVAEKAVRKDGERAKAVAEILAAVKNA